MKLIKPQQKPLPDGALWILTYFAFNKYGNKYEIAKEYEKYKVKLSYTWIHQLIKRLLKMNLIREDETRRKKAQTGLDKKVYTLTVAGLIRILNYESTIKMINLVAKNYAEVFPLVFGKWSFFIKEGMKKVAVERLINTIFYFRKNVSEKLIVKWTTDDFLKEKEINKQKDHDLKHFFDIIYDFQEEFLAEPIVNVPIALPSREILSDSELQDFKPVKELKEINDWFLMLNNDVELRAFITEVFKHEEKIMKFDLEHLISWKKWWSSISNLTNEV